VIREEIFDQEIPPSFGAVIVEGLLYTPIGSEACGESDRASMSPAPDGQLLPERLLVR
jgi:hypothetical protein